MIDLPDPRMPGDASPGDPASRALHALADASLVATTGQDADAKDARIVAAIRSLLDRGDGDALARTLDSAPTLAIRRHLWRALSREAGIARAAGDGVGVTLFAIPVVFVAASTNPADESVTLPGVIPDTEALVEHLREHRALAGNRTLALADALVAAATIDIPNLPALLASRALAQRTEPVRLQPAPIVVGRDEQAHLRFLVGSALAAPGADLLSDATVGQWGRPLANSLTRQLSVPGVAVVALPRAAASLPAAVALGRAAQREVSAQLFASNALRALRASFGEPIAVLSAHRASAAPGGGELRLSLSSPLSPRDAQGFCCPLYPGERVGDVATMLVDLLRDCRVGDVRVLTGVHGDRDPLTGGPLLFKAENLGVTRSNGGTGPVH
jgi:hypothetical protein